MAQGTGTLVILGFIFLVVCMWVLLLWRNTRRMHGQLNVLAQQQSLIRHDESARELCRAVHVLQPDAHAGIDYVIRHDRPGQPPYLAEWRAPGPQPSGDELRRALSKISSEDLEKNYASLRRAEYPSIGDQLDAAYKARQGNDAEQSEIDASIRKIKDKYPKSVDCL